MPPNHLRHAQLEDAYNILRPCDMTAEIEDRNVQKSGTRKVKNIQYPPHASISVRERMDAFKLMMNECHLDQRVEITHGIIIDELLEIRH